MRHQRKQHTHSTSSKRQFRCNQCDYVFTDYKKLFAHVSSQHPLGNIQTGGAQTTNSISAKRKSPAQHSKALGINNNAKNGQRTVGVSSEKRKQSIAVSEENALNGAVKNIIYPQKEELYDLLLLFANRREEIENFVRSFRP